MFTSWRDFRANLRPILLKVERAVILELRNQNVINDEVMRNIQRDLDFAEARLRHQR